MQALLSYDQSPPIAAPFRFFLSAPVFGVLSGLLLAWGGPDMLASRWTPSLLALTHLLTLGFMLQVMLGALIQILPVVAGANLATPMRLARIVHVALNVGTLVLAAAFLTSDQWLFRASAVLLATAVLLFVGAAGLALRGVPATSSTVRGLRLALSGACVAVGLGVGLSCALGWSLNWPLLMLVDVHLAWGLVGWGVVLLATVAYVVVPMFQITPAYPAWFERRFAGVVLLALLAWSAVAYLELQTLAVLLATALVLLVAAFALLTLKLQRNSRRARFDVNQRCWQVAMVSALTAGCIWLLALLLPSFDAWDAWPLLFGALILQGGFVTVIVGMLYKIVPFLVWLHLQNAGSSKRILAPNMKKIVAESAMERQVWAHFLASLLSVAAVVWPVWFVYPAAVALCVSNAWLLRNLLGGVAVYRTQRARIDAASGALPAER